MPRVGALPFGLVTVQWRGRTLVRHTIFLCRLRTSGGRWWRCGAPFSPRRPPQPPPLPKAGKLHAKPARQSARPMVFASQHGEADKHDQPPRPGQRHQDEADDHSCRTDHCDEGFICDVEPGATRNASAPTSHEVAEWFCKAARTCDVIIVVRFAHFAHPLMLCGFKGKTLNAVRRKSFSHRCPTQRVHPRISLRILETQG